MIAKFFKAGLGGAGSQLIAFISLPVISRIYAPEIYGNWAILIAAASIFGAVACMRYELALVLPRSDDEASSIFLWCIFSSCFMGILSVPIFFSPQVSVLIAEKFFPSYLELTWILPSLVILTGIDAALQYWCVRNQAFTLISLSLIVRTATTLFFQIVLPSYYAASVFSLLLGSLAGLLFSGFTLITGVLYLGIFPEISKAIFIRIPGILKSHKNFLYYSTPFTLFGIMRDRASLYILNVYLSPSIVGLYAFSHRILNFPVTLASSSLRPVLFQETAKRGVSSMENNINLMLKGLAIISVPPVVLFCYYPQDIFSFVFGGNWSGAGEIGLFLIWPVFTFLFCNWMDRILDVLKQQRLALGMEVIFSVTSLTCLWLGLKMQLGFSTALFFQVTILIFYNIFYLYIVYDRAGYGKSQLARLSLLIVSIGSISATLLYVAKLLLPFLHVIGLFSILYISYLLIAIYVFRFKIQLSSVTEVMP